MVDRGEVQRFVSRPDLIPPKITVVRRSPGDGAGAALPRPVVGPRAARGDDRRRRRRARLVPSDGSRERPEPPRHDLPRRAGSHLVGGQDQARPRDRRPRDRRPRVPGDRALPGGRRARLRPARADPHARGNGARHGLRHPDRRPLERRIRARARDRGGRAGARGPERPRALRVAEPRPRQAHRVLLEGRSRVRLLPRQRDRRRRRREPARLGP